jgi:hypothetical protein
MPTEVTGLTSIGYGQPMEVNAQKLPSVMVSRRKLSNFIFYKIEINTASGANSHNIYYNRQ